MYDERQERNRNKRKTIGQGSYSPVPLKKACFKFTYTDGLRTVQHTCTLHNYTCVLADWKHRYKTHCYEDLEGGGG